MLLGPGFGGLAIFNSNVNDISRRLVVEDDPQLTLIRVEQLGDRLGSRTMDLHDLEFSDHDAEESLEPEFDRDGERGEPWRMSLYLEIT
jgi:hypothetical protein